MGLKVVENPLPWVLGLMVIGIIGGALVMVASLLLLTPTPSIPPLITCTTTTTTTTTTPQLDAILHYATSSVVPQQSRDEISISFHVLKSLAPCNFLVFGLGHDSLMWAALNPGGTTLFLEEDHKWVDTVLNDAPTLLAYTVPYTTHLSQADDLLANYNKSSHCASASSHLRNNTQCALALHMLPNQVYDTQWDVIMIDAPRGYFPEAPGRMAAIYSAAFMARRRTKYGVTHVMLHDVDRRVEKLYAEKFLCRKYLVGAAGRLWHFEIPPVPLTTDNTTVEFC